MEPPSPLEVEMPTAVSKALLERAGMPEGRHRFRLRRLPTPPPQYDPDARTPPIANVYEGNISVRDGRVDLIKADRAAASSPVVPGATSNRPENAPRDGVPPLPPPSDEPLRGGVPLVPPNDNPARSDGNR
jgi:hypothetical protein